jgi:hypothetical protein
MKGPATGNASQNKESTFSCWVKARSIPMRAQPVAYGSPKTVRPRVVRNELGFESA